MNLIEVGKIVNTHGLHGEVKLVSWCDYPEIFEGFSNIYIEDVAFKIERVRYHKESVIAKLSGVESIDEAERLKNSVVSASRDEFDLPDGTYFIADIIGLKVRCYNKEIGIISDVLQTGANDVYVIKRAGQKDLLFPATPETLVNTDLSAGVVEVIIPEGLDEI